MPKARTSIVFRYANGDTVKWSSETYAGAGFGSSALDEPIYVDPAKCPYGSPESLQAPRAKVVSLAQRKYDQAMNKQIADKWAALHGFYGIDPTESDSASKLALALANAHVPGFQITSEKRTRKKAGAGRYKVPLSEKKKLVSAIESFRDDIQEKVGSIRTVTIKEACEKFVKRHPEIFKGRSGAPISARSLETRYSQNKAEVDRFFGGPLAQLMGLKNHKN